MYNHKEGEVMKKNVWVAIYRVNAVLLLLCSLFLITTPNGKVSGETGGGLGEADIEFFVSDDHDIQEESKEPPGITDTEPTTSDEETTETTNSTESSTSITSKPQGSSSPPPSSSGMIKYLPKTGETKGKKVMLMGLLVIGGTLLLVLAKKRKEGDSSGQ